MGLRDRIWLPCGIQFQDKVISGLPKPVVLIVEGTIPVGMEPLRYKLFPPLVSFSATPRRLPFLFYRSM